MRQTLKDLPRPWIQQYAILQLIAVYDYLFGKPWSLLITKGVEILLRSYTPSRKTLFFLVRSMYQGIWLLMHRLFDSCLHLNVTANWKLTRICTNDLINYRSRTPSSSSIPVPTNSYRWWQLNWHFRHRPRFTWFPKNKTTLSCIIWQNLFFLSKIHITS